MNKVISSETSLQNIEKIIEEELANRELWGDIALSEEEYQCIKRRLRTILEHESVDIYYVCKFYPNSLTTFLIFLVRYEYNTNFWGLVSEELGITINGSIESTIGSCVRSNFTRHHFDFSDVKEEVRVNLEPILYEAGRPPESSLDDLFYVLKYDTYSVFDPQIIIDDLAQMRAYKIRKPLQRFFKRFRNDRAVEFVLDVHDAMLTVDQGMSGDSHYIGNYAVWKAKDRTKEGSVNRKKQDFQTRPYLIFDNGKRGLCLVMPRTIMSDEWIEDVEWRITPYNEQIVCKRMRVLGDEGKRFVESITMPICPARNYVVSLWDKESIENGKIIEWTIEGIHDAGITCFNSNGRMVNSSYLLHPYGIAIIPNNTKIVQTNHVSVIKHAYPTDRDFYSTASIEPLGNDASVVFFSEGKSVTWTTKPQIRLICTGKTLFSLEQNNSKGLFTEIPILNLFIDEGFLTGGLKLRLGKTEIDISGMFVDGECQIPLAQIEGADFSVYGTYSIRLYQNEYFVKQIEFGYFPAIETNYHPAISWPDNETKGKDKTFWFRRNDEWQLEFEGCVVNMDENKYFLECPASIGSVRGVLKSTDDTGFSCSFELPVNPFEISVVDEQGQEVDSFSGSLSKISLEELQKKHYWIGADFYGAYRNNEYRLQLKTANGIEQEETFNLSQSGSCNIDLMLFYDTLITRPLPAIVELVCVGQDLPPVSIAVILDEIELLNKPFFVQSGYIAIDVQNGKKDLILRRFGKEEYEIRFDAADARTSKNKKTYGYQCIDIKEGLYSIEVESSSDEFYWDEDMDTANISNGNNTVFVSRTGKDEPIDSFSRWMEILIKDILIAGINSNINTMRAYTMRGKLQEYKKSEIDNQDYELMVALAYFVKDKCIDAKKEAIRECMRCISGSIMNGKRRLDLVRYLSELNCPQEVFDICLTEYNLLLLEPSTDDAKILAEKFEKKSAELALVLLMGMDVPIRDIWRERYREVIGKEALRTLLQVPDETNPEIIAEEQKRFITEQGESRVRINLNREISGDMEPIQSMIEVTYKSVNFNLSKKPDFGVYFDRIRYVDQYVNWYSLNHDKYGDMIPWKRDMMINLVKGDCITLLDSFKEIKQMNGIGPIARQYDEVLRYRVEGDPRAGLDSNKHGRYFYLQGIAAFLAKLPVEYRKFGWAVRAGEQFMSQAVTIAPRIARRDMLMASTFIYFKRKEEKLCR